MNRAQLKKVLKPLVKECIKEALFEEGILSGIISEVMAGLSDTPLISEKPTRRTTQQESKVVEEKKRRRYEDDRQERIRKLNESVSGGFGGIDLFEGTEPIPAEQGAQSQSAPGSMTGVDPGDPGVDISGLMGAAGGHWKKLLRETD